ncbi:hypothetical protein [Legionella jamestowniensis]|uniref:Transmembrane protein n=1 Tax=Legionella jamestowniensis TaxID=455 RepID=A0A0W0UIE9_9GAMM|nr:hypothetical protein [Legionella jamestowniensis]KTD07437.1 hypothetical protein Ljam_1632 [Legionella jamestowniensis]SFL92893.1 hypothetical protein SAMN02746073_2578 [Legionella jamestowniensis DSM 19215]
MRNFFNPFSGIIETRNTPHARTLRTSLKTKFSDTFYAFHGYLNNVGKPSNVGLFDYATLFISTAAFLFLQWCLNNKEHNRLAWLLFIPSAAINIPIYVARLAFSAVATLISAPVTLAVQGIVHFFNKDVREKALTIKLTTPTGYDRTLQEFLKHEALDLESLEATLQPVDAERRSSHIVFARKTEDKKTHRITYSPIEGYDIKFEPQQKQAVAAFFKLNIGRIETRLEAAKAKINKPEEADEIYSAFTAP